MVVALDLARFGLGHTAPNPPVGAVLAVGDRIVKTGWHREAGGPHAELYAIESPSFESERATLYVTLEPCSTWGRTPPCTEAILRLPRIARVVVAMIDPNPAHDGRGLLYLRYGGVQVDVGLMQDEAEALYRESLPPSR